MVGFKEEWAKLLAMGREVETAVDGRCKPRLFIKKMVLENFKSYAGKKHIGPFHKVRAVVVNRIAFFAMCVLRLLTIHVGFDAAVFFSCRWAKWEWEEQCY